MRGIPKRDHPGLIKDNFVRTSKDAKVRLGVSKDSKVWLGMSKDAKVRLGMSKDARVGLGMSKDAQVRLGKLFPQQSYGVIWSRQEHLARLYRHLRVEDNR